MYPIILTIILSLSFLNEERFQFSAENFDKALIIAKASERPIFLFFTDQNSAPCQLMEESVMKDSELVNKSNRKYITVSINQVNSNSQKLIKTYNITCLPSYVILNSEGVLVKKENGVKEAEGLHKFLEVSFSKKNRMVIPLDAIGECEPIDLVMMNNHIAEEAILNNDKEYKPFVAGRVEVTENTYSEMKAKSVKKGNSTMSNAKPNMNEESITAGSLGSKEVVNVKNKVEAISEDMIMNETESKKDAEEKITRPETMKKVSDAEEVTIKKITREDVIEPTSSELQIEYIQAGAFSSRSNADNLIARISQISTGIKVIESYSSTGKTLYKVWIGPVTSSTHGKEILSQLTQQKIDGFSTLTKE